MKTRKNKGITLIALVITIIVLLILAAVSIATLTGENGILTRANDAREETGQATAKEKVEIEVLGSYDKSGNISIEKSNENLENVEGLISGLPINKLPATVIVDGYEITIISDGNVLLGKADGSYNEVKKVNTPKLGSNMELVKYDEVTKQWVVDETNTEYSYEAQTGTTENGGTSEWANAELDGNYYVWIPRYAYKIDKNTKYTTQDGGESYKIDIKFLIGTTNKYYDESGNEKEAKIVTNADEILDTSNTDYYVHPAFTFGNTPLEGLWIGKYESSKGSNGKIAIVPNATSLININVSTMFSRAQELSKTDVDAHMLKNTEWGAAAYLSQSQYGRNGTEVSVNQCSSYITGTGKGTGSNPIYNSTYSIDEITEEQKYNGEIGKLSSTTGNVYGIYDMSGGAWEYAASYYSGSSNLSNGSQLVNEINREYVTAYNGTGVETDYKQGDETKETKGWNGDSAAFVSADHPFFDRGGYCFSTSNAGVFYFSRNYGSSDSGSSFRVCLAV